MKKVLKRTPDTSMNCNFTDIGKETKELQIAMRESCQLYAMGMKSDGLIPKTTFEPNDFVTRAQFGTILSRILFWWQYNLSEKEILERVPYYQKHLAALKSYNIMTKISNTQMLEIKWYVYMMLFRTLDILSKIQAWIPVQSATKVID